ncbi:MAG: methylated-DNA--[protein]-cysteine S-methyltransferase [Candidatus Sumerlaeia bacterium]|nr:methylated-DNA--[protein]-cysteine S-methyltransferase [Candidatus Sumerlaeia bacterium]
MAPLRAADSPAWHWHLFAAEHFGAGAFAVAGGYLVRVLLPPVEEQPLAPEPADPDTQAFAAELAACFREGRPAQALPHRFTGVAPFHAEVLAACLRIPPGSVWSYARLAAEAERPSAVRAAARAMAVNPLPLVVPCHRVVRSGGGLGGFGGGIEMKRHLLDMEARFRERSGRTE